MKMLLALVCFVLFVAVSFAEQMAQVEAGGIRVVLTNEPCNSDISNLPYRATWTENGKTVEGCFGMFGNQVLGFYFADKTIAVIPAGVFKRLRGV